MLRRRTADSKPVVPEPIPESLPEEPKTKAEPEAEPVPETAAVPDPEPVLETAAVPDPEPVPATEERSWEVAAAEVRSREVPAAEAPAADEPVEPASPFAPAAAAAVPAPPMPPAGRDPLPPIPPVRRREHALLGGIDLGGTKIAAAIITPDHEVIAYRRRPTPDTGGPGDVIKAMALTIQEAAQDAGIETSSLRGVGVGSPGAVDTETGTVSGAGNLPGWEGSYAMGTELSQAIGTEVVVGNDVSVGTEAEYRLGAGKDYVNLLGVFWGTGVGGGLILNGKPWHGRGKAGEIGHMVVKIGGAKCGCGNRGCMEAYAGRKSMETKAIKEHRKGAYTDLFKLAEKHGKPHLTSAIWAKALEHEDPLATELLDRAVKALSSGIASAVNLLDPDAVVIGGGLGIRFGDTLVPKIIEGMHQHLFDSDNPPPIKVAELGDEGGVIGASLLLEQLV